MDDNTKLFFEWLSKEATSEERKLREKAIDLEVKFFSDMTLEDYEEELGTVTDCETGNIYISDIIDPGSICIDNWRFKVIKNLQSNEGYDGICKSAEKLIEIDGGSNDDTTLIHEMIHAYESMMPECYRQFVLLRLYQKLLPQIPNLVSLVSIDNHTICRAHNPLFMLKSLDLDLRLNMPLGTIYAYNRKEYYLNA